MKFESHLCINHFKIFRNSAFGFLLALLFLLFGRIFYQCLLEPKHTVPNTEKCATSDTSCICIYVQVDRKRSIHPEISLDGKVAASTFRMLSIPFRHSRIFSSDRAIPLFGFSRTEFSSDVLLPRTKSLDQIILIRNNLNSFFLL